MRFLVLFAVLAAASAASITSDRRPEIVALCKKDAAVSDADLTDFAASKTLDEYNKALLCYANKFDLLKATFFTYTKDQTAEVLKGCAEANTLTVDAFETKCKADSTPVGKYVKCVEDYLLKEPVGLLANKHKFCVKDNKLTPEMEEAIKKMNFGTATETLKYLQCFGENTKLYHDQAFDFAVMKELYYMEVPQAAIDSFKTRCAEITRDIYDKEYDYVHNLFKCMTSDEVIKGYFLVNRYY